MIITKMKEGNATVVAVKGRMDVVSLPEFENEMEGLMAAGENNFIIDLGELDYISSAGLRSLLAMVKKLNIDGGKLFLASVKGLVQRVIKISGFTLIIPIYESVEAALSEI